MSKIAIIYGSSRPSKVGENVANWFKQKVTLLEGVELEMVDLGKLNLPMVPEKMPPIMGQYELDSTKQWAEKVASFDGVIFVAAEYNLGYTPILKNAIDTLFNEWKNKSTAIISYGGYPKSSSAEQLKTVLKPFEMKLAEQSLHVSEIHKAFDENGVLDETHVVGASPQEIIDQVSANIK